MPHWFFIALAAPLLWSIVNHIDKYMLAKYLQERGVGALLIFSALSSAVVLPFVAYFYGSDMWGVSLENLAILLLVGCISAAGLYFYLAGMEQEEASVVVPLFQLVPIFGYVLGYVILGEAISAQQLFSSLLIMFGIIVLTTEIDADRGVTFKTKVLMLVALSSFLFALYDTLFKKVAVVESFWVSIFWQHVGLVAAGMLLLVFAKRFRQDFFLMFRNMGGRIFLLNLTGEGLYILGNFANSFATLLAPVALVLVVSSYQPLFVFIGGILLTLFLPYITAERISPRHLAHKFVSIAIIFAGSYLLYSSS